MDIKSAMSEFGFGHRKTRHIIIDHDGELWLAMAPVAVGGFLAMGVTSLPGMLRVEPLENGEVAPFTYEATESSLVLTTAGGSKVRFAIDAEVQALRITGDAAFRLNGVSSASFVTTLADKTGVTINVGASHIVFTAKKGKIAFDDSWMLHEMHSVTPVLDIAPVKGEFELCVFDLPTDFGPPAVTRSFDDCVKGNGAEFKAFVDSLVDVPEEWNDVKLAAAYPLWLCHRVLDGKTEVIVENKYNSKETNSWLMAVTSMAFKDVAKALDLLLAYPVALPPIAGIAALRLIDDGLLCDSRGDIYRVYAALEEVARYCMTERSVDGEISYYAYRHECGPFGAPAFFDVGEPVIAPDLNAYLIIVSEVLGKLAHMEYDVGIANKWEAFAKNLKTRLIAELWNGEAFVGKNAYTGELSPRDKNLSPTPIVLGQRLPTDIIGKIEPQIDKSNINSSVGLLLVGGLFDAGRKASAKRITLKALENARSAGVHKPFYGASLLALAHKVLL
ncbi:MAG: hypothetical protein FWH33_02715 [Oscillospiraceae bacterium]|nr:hypothetical protein [Oscillospiraceae bacterium]